MQEIFNDNCTFICMENSVKSTNRCASFLNFKLDFCNTILAIFPILIPPTKIVSSAQCKGLVYASAFVWPIDALIPNF